jgi:hypothetical protein
LEMVGMEVMETVGVKVVGREEVGKGEMVVGMGKERQEEIV